MGHLNDDGFTQSIWTAGNDLMAQQGEMGQNHLLYLLIKGAFFWNLDFSDPFDYESFRQGEPNGGSSENCVMMRFPAPYHFL